MSNIDSPVRLKALAQSCLADAPSDPVVDQYAALLKTSLDVPVVLLSLVDDQRQFFSSQLGLPAALQQARETPLSHSFCQHVVNTEDELVVTNALEDVRVRENLAIRDLDVHAYAGVPIRSASGQVLGSFCAIDFSPREWTERELEILRQVAALVEKAVAAAQRMRTQDKERVRLTAINKRLKALVSTEAKPVHATLHDIRTPLSVLTLALDVLNHHDAAGDQEVATMLETMGRSVKHAHALIESAAATARQRVPPSGTVPCIHRLIDDVYFDFSTDPRLVWRGAPAFRDVPVHVTPVSVRRCIENFLRNAQRFAANKIELSLTEVNGFIEVSVDDDGPGLPTDGSFERAWEAHVGLHHDSGQSNTGLGLAIVRTTTAMHGGYAHAGPSVTLGGARFVCAFPRDTRSRAVSSD